MQEATIELRGFGIFKVKKRKARQARNPHNGEKVSVPEKFVVTFKAGQTSQKVSVPVAGDRTKEKDETFNLTLSSASNASILDAVGLGTIKNDDK